MCVVLACVRIIIYNRYTPESLPEISRASGVNIVAGTAYYVDSFLPDEVTNMTVEQV